MRRLYAIGIFTIISATLSAQNVSYDDDAIKLADRIMTIDGSLKHTIFPHSTFVTDAEMADFLNKAKADAYEASWSNADIRDINTYLLRSPSANLSTNILTNKNSTNTLLYNNSPHLFATQSNNSFLSLDTRTQSYFNIGSQQKFISTSIGALVKARVGNRLGLHAAVDYHTEQHPAFFRDRVAGYQAIPNVARYTINNNHYEYLQVNAHASYQVIKDGLTVSAGHSRHFIGDGIRSLIISDFATPMPFASIQTKIGKFHYTNLFLKPYNQTIDVGFNTPNNYKYIAIHYLSINATPWLNVGLFETVISMRSGAPEIGYFNPMIFYRSVERALGSPDKMAIGVTAKVIPFKKVQLYGQFFINEFTAKYFFGNQGYIHNKWGAQGGVKYFNALGINNLDLQAEVNIVRPYTYQHRSYANFSSRNMPIAHPLGAGFREALVAVGFRPFSKVRMQIQGSYYQQGLDSTASVNFGNNVIKNIRNNPGSFGVDMVYGIPVDVLNLQFTAGYEVFPSLMLEGGIYLWQMSQKDFQLPERQESYAFLGFRYNMARRNFMQF